MKWTTLASSMAAALALAACSSVPSSNASLDAAHRSYEQATNSPKRELKIFTDREGGVEHVGADNMAFGRDYIADWFAETLCGRTA